MSAERRGSRGSRGLSGTKPRVEALEGRALMSVQIVGKTTVPDTAGKITLSLQRSGERTELKVPETVKVSTGGGTAVPGIDYVPINQAITFAPGVRKKVISIPVFPHDPSTETKTFGLTVAGAPFPTNGTNSDSTLISIVHREPHGKKTAPPRIKQTFLLTNGDQVTAFVIRFDKPMDPSTVENLKNYQIQRSQGGANVSLGWAVYNARRREVTLVPAQAGTTPVGPYVVENPGQDRHSKITDVSGQLLDGVGDRMQNGILYATFSPRGPSVSPIVRAQIVADMRVHAAKQDKRDSQLGGSLGGGLAALLLL